VPKQPNQSWSLDFMSDSLSNGRAIRTLNILDDYNREALWIEVDTSLPAERVVQVLEQFLLWRAVPKQIRMDNGPELISKRLESWAKDQQIESPALLPRPAGKGTGRQKNYRPNPPIRYPVVFKSKIVPKLLASSP
jgi:putative transposase